MIGFDQSGNVKWSVPNDTPQIATSDGGVIGASGTTYDQNGNVDGQLASVPTYSWVGNAYQLGSIDQVTAFMINYASTFAALVGANNSANNTVVQQQWYPPLASCQDPSLNPPISCPGPKEAIWSALAALRSLVQSPCLKCVAFVFQPLGSIDDQTAFSKFLNRQPGLYDGTQSKMPLSQICRLVSWNGVQCSLWIWHEGLRQTTVADYFQSNPGLMAISQMPAENGLLTFFAPSKTCRVYAGQDSGIFNQAQLFHESLHGFYGKGDSAIQHAFGLAETDNTVNITFYIQNNVIGRPASICGN
jgi:hypothetical protein